MLQFAEDLTHADALHHHAGDADDVGPGAAREVDRLDILVDDRQAMPGRGQRRQQRQGGDRQRRGFADERQREFEAPERHLEARVDQQDIGHSSPSGPAAISGEAS